MGTSFEEGLLPPFTGEETEAHTAESRAFELSLLGSRASVCSLPQCGLPGSLTQECFGTGPKSLQCRPGRKRWGGDGFSGPPPYPGPEVTEGLKRGTKNVQSHPDSDPVRGCPLDGTVRARWPCPPVDWSLPGTFWQAQTMQVAGEGRRRGRGGEGREAWLMGQAQGREG